MQERRLAAIMFTDIVGYTALMGSDEEKAFKVLRTSRKIQKELVSKYGGRWIKEMGDGVLSSFSTASDAVLCAIEIQQRIASQDIPLRIGIHLGEVLFENEDAFGDGVNVASRLQEYSRSGHISISGAVYNNVKNKIGINTVFLEEKILKNVTDPIKIYNVSFDLAAEEILSAGSDPSEKSIAVLPFVNMSTDQEQEYFCDGITEEIINALTHVEKLKVIARTSAFEFKNLNEDIRKIGAKLNVSHILEGSVRKAGNRLRITAQLIEVADGSHLWSERYDRELKDVFEIQDEISLAIVDRLRIQLFENERLQILKTKTHNLQAYNFYLKGRHHWNMRSKEGLDNSIYFFKKSIELDREFALAYSGLADAYAIQYDWGYILSHEAYKLGIKNILRSLEIDNTLGETYVSLGYFNGLYEWNKVEAEKNFRKALTLNPNYPTAHQWMALFLSMHGRMNEALYHIKIAMELNPLSLAFNLAYGLILYFGRRFEKAIDQLQNILHIKEDSTFPHFWLAQAYLRQGNNSEAAGEYLKMISKNPETSARVSELEEIYEESGIDGIHHWLVKKKVVPNNERLNSVHYVCLYYCALGDRNQALKLLEEGVNMHNVRFGFSIKTDGAFDFLRQEPGFKRLLERMNLQE